MAAIPPPPGVSPASPCACRFFAAAAAAIAAMPPMASPGLASAGTSRFFAAAAAMAARPPSVDRSADAWAGLSLASEPSLASGLAASPASALSVAGSPSLSPFSRAMSPSALIMPARLAAFLSFSFNRAFSIFSTYSAADLNSSTNFCSVPKNSLLAILSSSPKYLSTPT